MTKLYKSFEYEKEFESFKWANSIPYIRFKEDWDVRIIPPHTGAVIRFLVKKGNVEVSVYLDCYDTLGLVGESYWEIYPDQEEDCTRVLMNNVDELLEAIQKSIDFNYIS